MTKFDPYAEQLNKILEKKAIKKNGLTPAQQEQAIKLRAETITIKLMAKKQREYEKQKAISEKGWTPFSDLSNDWNPYARDERNYT